MHENSNFSKRHKPGTLCRASLYIYAALALCSFLRKPQSSTKSLEHQRKNATIHNSLRSINPATAGCSLQKPTGLFAYRSRGLETFVFLPRQILRTPRFCLRTKSLHLLSKFSSQYIAILSVIPYIYTYKSEPINVKHLPLQSRQSAGASFPLQS